MKVRKKKNKEEGESDREKKGGYLVPADVLSAAESAKIWRVRSHSLTLRANLRLLFLVPASSLDCVICG